MNLTVYLNNSLSIKNIHSWCVKETPPPDVSIKHQNHMFDRKTLKMITLWVVFS